MTASVSIGRLIEAKEIAYLVAFLASPKSIAINGETIAAGGGIIGPIRYLMVLFEPNHSPHRHPCPRTPVTHVSGLNNKPGNDE